MPNWCSNTVTLNHADKSKVEAMRNAIKDGKFFETVLPIGEWDYDRAVKTWGTKWEPEITYINDSGVLQLSFESAWSPPIGVYTHLIEKEGWEVEAFYFEGGMGFCGSVRSLMGVVVDSEYQISGGDWIPKDIWEAFHIGDWYSDGENGGHIEEGEHDYRISEQ